MSYFIRLFQGRLNRRTYFFSYVVGGIYYVISGYLLSDERIITSSLYGFQYVAFIITIATLLIIFYLSAYGIGRLHDLGYSGWFILFELVPLLNIAFLIALIFRAGDKQVNRYGTSPKPKVDVKALLGLP